MSGGGLQMRLLPRRSSWIVVLLLACGGAKTPATKDRVLKDKGLDVLRSVLARGAKCEVVDHVQRIWVSEELAREFVSLIEDLGSRSDLEVFEWDPSNWRRPVPEFYVQFYDPDKTEVGSCVYYVRARQYLKTIEFGDSDTYELDKDSLYRFLYLIEKARQQRPK
jgi:hypothetical protein